VLEMGRSEVQEAAVGSQGSVVRNQK